MALELSGTPDLIRSLVETLQRQGFRLLPEEGGGAVNRVLEATHEAHCAFADGAGVVDAVARSLNGAG